MSISSTLTQPKSLLHVHWEGSVRLETLERIAARKRIPGPPHDLYSFQNFDEFNRLFPTIFANLTEEDDFYELARAFVDELRRENIVYCETFFVPLAHVRRGVPFECFFPPMIAAFEEAEKMYAIRVNLIYSIVRFGGNAEWGEQTLDFYKRRPDPRIVGIDLAGPESFDTIAPFAPVFSKAKSLGLHLTAHSGEFCGAEHVKETINLLNVERVGHGIGAVSDPQLIETLIQRNIPLEICPTSNSKLGAVANLAEHPLRKLYDLGVPIVIGTDDPAFFGNTLVDEYELLRKQFGFNDDEIGKLIRNSFNYSFDSNRKLA